MNKFKKVDKIGRTAVIALLMASSNITLAQDDTDQDVSSNGNWEFASEVLLLHR